MTPSVAELAGMTVEERLELMFAVWTTIVAEGADALPLTDAERAELDRRLDAYARDPSASTDWDELRDRILAGR